MNKIIKRLIAVIISVITVCSMFIYVGVSANSSGNTYMQNNRFHNVGIDIINDKYENNEKFLAYVCKTDCSNSKKIGTEIISSFMNDDNCDIFAAVDETDSKLNAFDWLFDYADNVDLIYDESNDECIYYPTPFVLFVDSGKVTCFMGYNNSTYDRITKKYSDFYPKTDVTLSAIEIKSLPNKLLYQPGETFDDTGMSLTLIYSDGSISSVYSGFKCSTPDMSTEGFKEIAVTYENFCTKFEINVSNSQVYKIDCKFHQTEARSMLANVNRLREESAWYWDEDDKTKINLKLQPLQYDYELEKSAMQRAVEIMLYYDHTRTDGSPCSTVFPQNWNTGAIAENISYGYETADDAFNAWEQSKESYMHQGHRRNMLKADVTAIGIACASMTYTDSITQKDIEIRFWVQLFRAPTINTEATEANDYLTSSNVEILNTTVKTSENTVSVDSYSLVCGSENLLPSVLSKIKMMKPEEISEKNKSEVISDDYDFKFMYDLDYAVIPECIWQTMDSNVAKITDGKVLGILPGTTSIYTTVGCSKITIPVTVTSSEKNITYSTDIDKYSLKVGASHNLPTISVNIDDTKYYPATIWTVGNPNIAVIKNNNLCAISPGSTSISTKIGEKTITIPVNVTSEQGNTPDITTSFKPTTEESDDQESSPTTSENESTTHSSEETTEHSKPAIKIPTSSSERKADYKSTLIFRAEVKNALEKSEIRWYVDGNYTGKTGTIFTIEQIQRNCVVHAKLYENGSSVCKSNDITIITDTSFFAKIVAFFRGLFKSLPIVNI